VIDVRVLSDADAVAVATADLIDAVAATPEVAARGFATGSSPERSYREILCRHAGRPNPYRAARSFSTSTSVLPCSIPNGTRR
jgi:hypothetical protein